jgi:hypothetical protein
MRDAGRVKRVSETKDASPFCPLHVPRHLLRICFFPFTHDIPAQAAWTSAIVKRQRRRFIQNEESRHVVGSIVAPGS